MTEDQFKNEFLSVCKMYLKYFKIFGIKKYEMRLSLHDIEQLGNKYINEAINIFLRVYNPVYLKIA